MSNDPSWCPPGEDFTIVEAKGTPAAHVKKDDAIDMKPNAAKRPTAGAVHAAVY